MTEVLRASVLVKQWPSAVTALALAPGGFVAPRTSVLQLSESAPLADLLEPADAAQRLIFVGGKGGVGKSTMTAQLAFALAGQGLRVGLLDIDICGPSIPHMLGLTGESIHQSASGWSPVYVSQEGLGPDDDDVELGVMSIGFMLPDKDRAVIWRGPRKNGLIKQFLTDVEWGELDYLLVDTPPGTSDEHISLVQYLAKALGPNDGALVVSTPQEVSLMDVRKELSFCAKTKLRVLGVVENMSEYAAPLPSLLAQARQLLPKKLSTSQRPSSVSSCSKSVSRICGSRAASWAIVGREAELVLEAAPGVVVRDDVARTSVHEGEAAVEREGRPAAEAQHVPLLPRAALRRRRQAGARGALRRAGAAGGHAPARAGRGVVGRGSR